MSRQVMPISVILIGSQAGHLKLAPVAEPTLMKTPKPGFVTKVPSPRNAKLRPSPPSTSEPIVTSAPTERKLTISSLGGGRGVDGDVGRVQREHRAQRDLERVGAEDEALDLAVLELQAQADRLGIGHPGRDVRLGQPVADDGRDRLARQERAPPEAKKIVPSKSPAGRR
jgi:hypothetical protein